MASVEGNNLVVFYYLIASESCLIREVLFGEHGFIRRVVFGGCGFIRGVVFGGRGFIRGRITVIQWLRVVI